MHISNFAIAIPDLAGQAFSPWYGGYLSLDSFPCRTASLPGIAFLEFTGNFGLSWELSRQNWSGTSSNIVQERNFTEHFQKIFEHCNLLLIATEDKARNEMLYTCAGAHLCDDAFPVSYIQARLDHRFQWCLSSTTLCLETAQTQLWGKQRHAWKIWTLWWAISPPYAIRLCKTTKALLLTT